MNLNLSLVSNCEEKLNNFVSLTCLSIYEKIQKIIRLFKKLNLFMSIVAISGAIAFFTSVVGLLPQVLKSIKTRSTRDISSLMLINYLICSLAWVVYSFYTHTAFVFWSNVLGGLSSLFLLILKYHHDRRIIEK